MKLLHDELTSLRREMVRARRKAVIEAADGCPATPFKETFTLGKVPAGWRTLDPAGTELRSWERDGASVRLVPGTPLSQAATPRHRTPVLGSVGWVGHIGTGFSVEFTFAGCVFSLVGEGTREDEVELFGALLRASS